MTSAAALLLLTIAPIGQVAAQDDDLDEMMKTDPDKPAAEPEEEEGESPAAENAAPSDSEREAATDEERPPGEESKPSESTTEPEAEAAPADDGTTGFNLGLLAGYGASLENGANLWGGGFGVQAGYDLGIFVLSVRFVYYLGGSTEIPRIDAFQQVTGSETFTANLWELGVEGAFDVALSKAVSLRPGLGFGFASVSGATTSLVGAVSPGAALLFNATDSLYLGLDARFQLVASTPEVSKALLFLATIGMRF